MADPLIKSNESWNYAQYTTWNDNERWEIIDGVVYNMSPAPNRFHQQYIGAIFVQFYQALKGKPCQAFIAPFDVRFIDPDNQSDSEITNVVQPDILIVCDQKKLDVKGCRGTPDLIVEVLSPSTMKKDRNEKFKLYEKYGVQQYWLIYPGEDTIEIFTLENGVYGPSVLYDTTETIQVPVAGGFTIAVKEVFS